MPRAPMQLPMFPNKTPVLPQIDVMIDSGAYSAWRLNDPIDLGEYINFLKANQDWIYSYVALDVINPGNPEAAAAAGYDNYLRMRDAGLDPIPVLHAGESIHWLWKFIDAGATYIGLSASSIVSRGAVDDWYEMVWNELVTADGLPIIKAHAFGEGRESSLRKFPWFSADSASWLYAAQRTGTVQLDTGDKFACRKDGAGTDATPDINTLDDMTRDWLHDILAQRGINPKAFTIGGADSFIVSTYCAGLYYIELEKHIAAACPIHYYPHGFLHSAGANNKHVHIPAMRMFLVGGGNPAAFSIFAKTGHKNMLVSYVHTRANTRGGKQISIDLMRQMIIDPIKAMETKSLIQRYYDLLNQYVK